jgi:hypothetical protein
LPEKGKPRLWTWVADCVLLYALATAILNPLYRFEYLNAWNSIEATFISDARFLRDHWPHPGWQPNWYTGTRFDYIYPPALRYGTAALSLLRGVSTARSYHLYIALLYAIGIVGVYLFVRTGSRGRWPALWTALATMVVSPGYLIFSDLANDNQGVYYMPLRLSALIRYGEGPHISALALLPLALAAAWLGLRRGHPGRLAIAAAISAMVVANNFYGATALAMFFPILAWNVWIAERDWSVWARAALTAVLAWGLCAFWLTPSYLRVTLENMRWVSSPGHGWSAALGAGVAALYLWLSWRLVRGRPERAWASFVLGSLALFTLNVVGNHFVDFRVIGEPKRLVPELDLVILMAAALMFAWIAGRGSWWRAVAVVLALVCFYPGKGYVRRVWTVLPPRDDHQHRVEYQMTTWIAANLPGVRSLATGSMRFWYNTWHDLPQLGGGSEQGLLNRYVQDAYVSPTANDDPPAQSVAWMQAMGVGALIVHDKTSQEIYKDWANPLKFEGILEKSYDDGAGNRIYMVPRRFPDLARVVDAAALRSITAIDGATLRQYAAVVENGPGTRAAVEALGTDAMRVRGQVAPGQLVVVQQTYDPAWRCYSGDRQVSVSKDAMGFVVLDPGPGNHDLLFRFETPLENRLGAAAALVSAAAVAFLLWRSRIRAA